MAFPGEAVAEAIKEGLALWRTFIATRQEAYDRKRHKHDAKAIKYAEEYIDTVSPTPLGQEKELQRLKRLFLKYHK